MGGRSLDVRTDKALYDDLFVALHGQHQGINAALAISAAEAFLDGPLDDGHLRAGLAAANLPGRFEVVASDPLIVLDGAHNVDGARCASDTFEEDFHVFGRKVLVVGMMRDKDPLEMLKAFDLTRFDAVMCTEPQWPRAMKASALASCVETMGIHAEYYESPVDAIESVLDEATEADAILVSGSMYLAGSVRDHLLADYSAT